MIDGSPIAKRRGGKRPHATFVAKSVPAEDNDFEELEFPGPSAAYRGEGKKPRAGSFYMSGRPNRAECLPRELNLEVMSYTGYWRCLSPCCHVQTMEQGERCEKCGRTMVKESAVPK